MSGKKLVEGRDYDVVDGTVVIKDHISIPPSTRVVVDESGVSLVPAREPAVGLVLNSAPSVASTAGPLYRRGDGGRRGRRASRHLPQN